MVRQKVKFLDRKKDLAFDRTTPFVATPKCPLLHA